MSTPITLYECTICNGLHPWNWSGDCRDNANRYTCVEEYAERNKLMSFTFKVRSMCERLAADGTEVHKDKKDIVDGECRFCGKKVATP